MKSVKASSTLRTFRIPTETFSQLHAIADERGVKLNALVNTVLERFLDWSVFVERYGMVTLSKETYRLLLDEIQTEQVSDVASKMLQHVRDYSLLKFRILSMETALAVFQDFCRFANLGTATMSKDEDELVITVSHPHGWKHSLIAKQIAEDLFEETTRVKPQIIVTENVVVCRVRTRPNARLISAT